MRCARVHRSTATRPAALADVRLVRDHRVVYVVRASTGPVITLTCLLLPRLAHPSRRVAATARSSLARHAPDHPAPIAFALRVDRALTGGA